MNKGAVCWSWISARCAVAAKMLAQYDIVYQVSAGLQG